MSVNIIPTQPFEKEAKKLLKKYVSLKNELMDLFQSLTENPRMGDQITQDAYKIRVAVKSKGKGKSGGLRVITFVLLKIEQNEDITNVFLLSIYDKSEYEAISDKIIAERINEVRNEIENRE